VTPDAKTSNANACVSEEAAMDALMEALAALDTLNKCAFTEIKHMKNAPNGKQRDSSESERGAQLRCHVLGRTLLLCFVQAAWMTQLHACSM
jgi:hypothetical protein